MISLLHNGNTICICLQADILNNSETKFDLGLLQRAIEKQLQHVYHTSVGKYAIDIQLNIHVISSVQECSIRKVLFQIVDEVAGNNPAEADFKGLRVKLNKAHLNDIIQMRNNRTIPHEIGHLFGWDHPHARAMYESVNSTAHMLEQQMTEVERKHNLMSQTWYVQRAGLPLESAMQISEKQIELLLLNYLQNNLNKNYHLKRYLFWKKIV